jgi:CRP-like cAMP-binding protein
MNRQRTPPPSPHRDGPAREAAVPWVERAQRTGLFQGLAPGEIAAIAAAGRRRRVSPRGVFFHQGSPASGLHVLMEGRAKILQTTAEGHEVLVRVVGPGEMFGGVALFGDMVYPAAAQAVTACEALAWPSDALGRLVARYPALALNALRVLAGRLQDLQDRYRELATERVERRVARAVLRLGHQLGRRDGDGVLVDVVLSRQDLAELTGTTLYTVSRILSRWRERGLVEIARRRLVIRQPHGLVTIAEDLPPPGTSSCEPRRRSLRWRKDDGPAAR